MAEPAPSGILIATEGGRDLILSRSFPAGIDQIWAELADPERTARWFGPWSGEAEPGATIRCQMAFEDGKPEIEMEVRACERPHHLGLYCEDDYGSWHLEVDLSEEGGETTFQLTHHLDVKAEPGSVGPGWEWYLDMLVAARSGGPAPAFDDYFPAQKAYYEGLEPG